MASTERPPPPPKTMLRGGIRTHPFAAGGSWPFGRLEFDEGELVISGLGLYQRALRSQVQAIRLSTGLLCVNVDIVWAGGKRATIYFVTWSGDAVGADLLARRWPVEDTRWRRLPRPTDHRR